MNLSEKYVFNGHTLRYDICGAGPPVVLVHGTPWSSFNLRHIFKSLSKNFTVYYYDLLGYGQSDKSPDDVSLGIQNQIRNGLLDHWQLEQPATIGHDFGGATLLRTHLLNARDLRLKTWNNSPGLSMKRLGVTRNCTWIKETF